jgi:photosystem II stability/assembly factor-like uncharacterized protein
MTRTAPAVRLALALVALAAAPLGAQTPVAPVATEFEKLHFRSIGPATMSGRIADVAVYEANPAVYYVGTAHGGVWKTTSNGALMTPLLQDKGLLAIGDIAVSQLNPDVVYVGTGESNNRQSGSWGEGVYKSTDGGKTWTHIGLGNSKHINRIVLDPNNNDVAFVAATGALYGPGGDRGVFKTTDGGKSWRNVLKTDENTGANDLVVATTDPNVMYASTYQRRRSTCCMNGGGPGSGIWKSTDAGEHWTRLAGPGLPTGPLGRIGLDAYRRASNIVYASIEGPGGGGFGAPPAAPAVPGAGGRGGAPADPGITGIYRSDDGGTTWRRLHANNPRPMYFSQVRIDPNNPDRVYMGGVGLQMTIDGGKSWETDAALVTHDDVHAIWIDPNNSDHLMIGNDGGLAVSYDMSRTWTFIPNLPVGLFYHVGYDMEVPYNVCGGMQDNYDWCGPSRSRHTAGIYNYDWFQVLGGDGFVAIPDLRDSRIVYTESQDGNIVRRNKVTGESKSIRPSPANVIPAPATGDPAFRFHWDTPLIISAIDNGTLLVAANKVFKSTDRGDSWTAISPDLTNNASRDSIVTMGLKGSDINISRNDGVSSWPTIVALAESPKQAGLYYAGTDDGNVQVSRDGGKTWQNVTSKIPGFPARAFVSEVVPSRFDAGTVYVTVENHRENDYEPHIWVSNDFGNTFASLNGNLKGEVARTLTEDTKNADVLYLGTETGIFVSLDRGKSWRRLKANFPTVRVDELTIMPRDNALLIASHGRALWILDDLSPIQEYTAANAADAKLFTPGPALQWKQMDNRNDEFWGHQNFIGENPPLDAVIAFNLKKTVPGLGLRITDAGGRTIRAITIAASRNQAGIQTVCWDQRVEPIVGDTTGLSGFAAAGAGGRGGRGGGTPAVPGIPVPLPTAGYLPANPCASGPEADGSGGFGFFAGLGNAGPHVMPGNYTVQLVANDAVLDSKPLRIVGDPAVRLADNERKKYNDVATELHELQRRATSVQSALNALNRQITAATPLVRDGAAIPADVKAQYEAFTKEWDGVRRKFGVGAPAGLAGRGGGGGRGAVVDPENVVARLGGAKSSVGAFWETPSASVMQQYNDAKAMLPKAITDANAFIAKASAMSGTLKTHNVTLTVPAAIK